MTLVEEIYRITRRFPKEEQFGLTAQIRRASVSIASNIGEGKRRKRQRVYLHHLDVALGSQGEVDVQLEIALRIGLLGPGDYRRAQDLIEASRPHVERSDLLPATGRLRRRVRVARH